MEFGRAWRTQKKNPLALRCTSEEATERKPHFLAGVAADMPHRPRWDILSPQTTYRISGTWGAGVYGCPPHTLLEEKSLLTFMKQSHSGPTVGSASTVCGVYCAGVYGARKCENSQVACIKLSWRGVSFHSGSRVRTHVHLSGALYQPLSVGGWYKSQFNIRNWRYLDSPFYNETCWRIFYIFKVVHKWKTISVMSLPRITWI